MVKTVHMDECLKHDFSALILSTSFCLCLVTRWTQAKLPTADIRLVFCVSEFYRKMTTLKTSTFGTTANGKEVTLVFGSDRSPRRGDFVRACVCALEEKNGKIMVTAGRQSLDR